jgi:pSer/pThr/pTyr-binding forkhead associated (FHA) protein
MLALVFLLVVAPSYATTYYVDKAGSDSNSCATAALAALNRTFARLTIGSHHNSTGGLHCARAAGDIVIVGNGTYVEAERVFQSPGAVGNPITLRAENKWLAILSSTSSCNPNISVQASYITIDGLSLVINAANVYCTPNSAAGTGIRFWNTGPPGSSGYVGGVARNIKTDDPTGPSGKIRSHGIKSNQDNALLEDNELGAGAEILGDNTVVRRNHITGGGNWNNGIVAKGGPKNVQVYDNVIDSTTINGVGIVLGGLTNNSPTQECWNCVAWNNVVRMGLSGQSLAFQGCRDCAFFNNVAFGAPFGSTNGFVSSNVNNTWRNNILTCNGGNALDSTTGTHTIDYNDFFNCTGVPSQAHPITGDPRFVNPQSDWHLSLGSPAIGSGVQVSFIGFNGGVINVSVDADGLPRILPWSLGRYRSVGTTDITPPLPPVGLVVN